MTGPFICPWHSEGCQWITMDEATHRKHVRQDHEIPMLRKRGMPDNPQRYNQSIRKWRKKKHD